MVNFSSKWQKPQNTESLGSKIKGSVRSNEPLKPKIEAASRQIQVQVAKLEQTSAKLREKDGAIFARVVAALQKNDTQHANMLASELSEVRKMNKIVMQSKLALEQITLRLSTVQELGDLALTLAPAMNVIKGVRTGLVGLVPDAEKEIGEISGLIGSLLVEAGQMSPTPMTFEVANDDADRVLAEANLVVERRMSEKFPDVPVHTDSDAETA